VPVFDVGRDGDVRFYAMQFIQGQGLDAIITELQRLRLRAGSAHGVSVATGGQLPGPSGGRPGQGVGSTTPGEKVEVSALLRSILTGQFDPGGRGPGFVEGRTPTLVRALAHVWGE
jgi:hypothetical protein